MKTKMNHEVEVSYRNLGEFVRQKRKSLGYTSIDRFALATGIDKTYIVRLENGKQFGSPESFVAIAKALGVSPGFLMDVFAEYIDFEGNPIHNKNSIDLPEDFTQEDKQFLEQLISFLSYQKQLGARHRRHIAQIEESDILADLTPDVNPKESSNTPQNITPNATENS